MSNRQLSKSILICLLLSSQLTAFGQFTNDLHIGAKVKGKVRSVITCGYDRADSTATVFTHLWFIDEKYYNRKGQLVKTLKAYEVRGSDISDKLIDTLIYDHKGNLKDIIHYDTDGKPAVKERFVFARPRFVIVKRHLYSGDTSRYSEQFKLDASNRIIEKYNYGSYTDTSIMTYNGVERFKYNKQGYQILRSSYRPDGNLGFYTEITYNKGGDLVKSADFAGTPDKKLFTGRFSYSKYDSRNNWIQCFRVNTKGKPNRREERTITYYK